MLYLHDYLDINLDIIHAITIYIHTTDNIFSVQFMLPLQARPAVICYGVGGTQLRVGYDADWAQHPSI
jgi:hypothetical protein